MNHFRIILTMIFTVIITSCYNNDDYLLKNIKIDEVITAIEFSNGSIIANGVDTTEIVVQLPLKADENLSKVWVSASKGTFSNDSNVIFGYPVHLSHKGKEVNAYKCALKSGIYEGHNLISISVGGITKDTTITFTKSYPESIQIIPSALSIDAGVSSELDIKVKLISSKGSISAQHPISINAYDKELNSIGSFRIKEEISNSNIYNSIYSVIPDTIYKGEISFVVKTRGVNNTDLTEQVKVYSY